LIQVNDSLRQPQVPTFADVAHKILKSQQRLTGTAFAATYRLPDMRCQTIGACSDCGIQSGADCRQLLPVCQTIAGVRLIQINDANKAILIVAA